MAKIALLRPWALESNFTAIQLSSVTSLATTLITDSDIVIQVRLAERSPGKPDAMAFVQILRFCGYTVQSGIEMLVEQGKTDPERCLNLISI